MKEKTAVEWFYDKIKSHFEHDGDLLETLIFTMVIAKEKELHVSNAICSKKIELTADELLNLLKEAYRNGYATYEMVDDGLESYDADGYARWILLGLK
jgi:hypothetical protein